MPNPPLSTDLPTIVRALKRRGRGGTRLSGPQADRVLELLAGVIRAELAGRVPEGCSPDGRPLFRLELERGVGVDLAAEQTEAALAALTRAVDRHAAGRPPHGRGRRAA